MIPSALITLFLIASSPQEQAAPPATPAATAVRKLPVAKSQDEYAAYKAAAMQPDLTAADKLAADFASRFPESELREALYQTLMLKQQSANNAGGALMNAERVLLLDPQDPVALVVAANVLSERTQPTSADAPQRFERGMRYAERALENIASAGVSAPESASPEEVAKYRAYLVGIAHAAEGNIELLRKNYMEAEKHFQAALAAKTDPDALVLYRLALAQHGLKRLDDALASTNKAMAAAGASRDLLLQERIKQERATLIKAGAKG